MIQNKQIN